jgi:hypothetical protein
VLSLLLVGAQHEGVRHALSHWGSSFAGDQKQSLRVPVNVPCDECTLLAGSTHAVAATIRALPALVPIAPLVFWLGRSLPQPAPAYYQAQAPPSSL